MFAGDSQFWRNSWGYTKIWHHGWLLDPMKETEVLINLRWIRLSLRFLLFFFSISKPIKVISSPCVLPKNNKQSNRVFWFAIKKIISVFFLAIAIATLIFPGKCINRTRIAYLSSIQKQLFCTEEATDSIKTFQLSLPKVKKWLKTVAKH